MFSGLLNGSQVHSNVSQSKKSDYTTEIVQNYVTIVEASQISRLHDMLHTLTQSVLC